MCLLQLLTWPLPRAVACLATWLQPQRQLRGGACVGGEVRAVAAQVGFGRLGGQEGPPAAAPHMATAASQPLSPLSSC